MLEQEIWRGIPLYDVLWRKRHLTRRELHSVYTSSYTAFFWVLNISILSLLDLHGFGERVSVFALVSYTASITLLTFMIYFLVCEIGITISQRHSRFFLILPVVGIIGATFSTYVVELGMSSFFGNGVSLERAAEKLPVNIALTLALETFYLTFVLPIALGSRQFLKNRQEARENSTCKTLIIAGKSFFCDQLMSVTSQDHYVRICTKTEQCQLRARLSDIIKQLDCQNGIQPHRSHWVARHAVSGLANKDGHKVLELHNGHRIPIARGRLVDVQEWLEG